MGHGLLGKVLSNPVADVGLALGGVGLLGGLGGLGGLLGGGAGAVGDATALTADSLGAGGMSAAEMMAAAGGAPGGMALSDATSGIVAGDMAGSALDPFTGYQALQTGLEGTGVPSLAGGVPSSTLPSATAPSSIAQLFSRVPGASNVLSAFQGSKGGLGAMEVLSGLYALDQSRKLQAMTRPPNPADLTKMPGYQAGLEAVERSLASQGYQGSGNMMAALQKYGGDAYSQMWQGNISSAQAAEGGLGEQLGGLGLLTGGLSNLMGWNAPGKGG